MKMLFTAILRATHPGKAKIAFSGLSTRMALPFACAVFPLQVHATSFDVCLSKATSWTEFETLAGSETWTQSETATAEVLEAFALVKTWQSDRTAEEIADQAVAAYQHRVKAGMPRYPEMTTYAAPDNTFVGVAFEENNSYTTIECLFAVAQPVDAQLLFGTPKAEFTTDPMQIKIFDKDQYEGVQIMTYEPNLSLYQAANPARADVKYIVNTFAVWRK